MTEIELKNRAQRLMAKLNSLGFSKNGKPMVVDQAFELIAAEEGHRNQHVLRTKLETAQTGATALVMPRALDEEFAKAVLVQHSLDGDDWTFASEAWDLIVGEAAKRARTDPVTSDSEHAANGAFSTIVSRMGWNDASLAIHLERFIRDSCLMGELVKYAERVAAEEDDSGAFLDEPILDASEKAAIEPASASMIALLQSIGYEMKESEFNSPFWECGSEGSEDFVNEAQAWDDAWLDAVSTTCAALSISLQDWPKLQIEAQRKGLEQFNRHTLSEMAELLSRCGFEFKAGASGSYTWRHADDVQTRTPSASLTRAVVEAWTCATSKIGLPESVFTATPFEALLVLVEAGLTGRVDGETEGDR